MQKLYLNKIPVLSSYIRHSLSLAEYTSGPYFVGMYMEIEARNKSRGWSIKALVDSAEL